jgi:hypothetical protein
MTPVTLLSPRSVRCGRLRLEVDWLLDVREVWVGAYWKCYPSAAFGTARLLEHLRHVAPNLRVG